MLYYAEVHEYFSDNAFRNFSVKMPLQGQVHYRAGKNRYDLRPGMYMLASRQPGEVIVDSGTMVKALCIDISEQTMQDAFSLLTAKQIELDMQQQSYFSAPHFFDHVYTYDNRLGNYLRNLSGNVLSLAGEWNEEIFLSLAGHIVEHELENYHNLARIPAIKNSTRKELYRRLLSSRDYIDANFLQKPGAKEMAEVCNMSVFHFYRSFKQAFGYSPYQYIMEKKLEYAKDLISKGARFNQVSVDCGFPDLPTFSKAFKRKYKTSPSVYKKLEMEK